MSTRLVSLASFCNEQQQEPSTMRVGSSNCSVLLFPPSLFDHGKEWKVGTMGGPHGAHGDQEKFIPGIEWWDPMALSPSLNVSLAYRHALSRPKAPRENHIVWHLLSFAHEIGWTPHFLNPPFFFLLGWCPPPTKFISWYPLFISCTASLLSHPCLWLLDHPFIVHFFQ